MDKKILRKDTLAGKITAFVVVIIMVAITILSGMQIVLMMNNSIYGGQLDQQLRDEVEKHYSFEIIDKVVWNDYREYEIYDSAVYGAQLIEKRPGEKAKVIWKYGNVDKMKEPIREIHVKNLYEGQDFEGKSVEYETKLFVDPQPKIGSGFYTVEKLSDWCVKTQNSIYFILIGAIVIGAGALVYLLAAAGHKKGAKDAGEISGSFITKIPVDLYTLLTAIVGIITIGVGTSLLYTPFGYPNTWSLIVLLGIYLVCAFISLLWLMDMTVRIKMGKWWKNSLIYRVVRFMGHGGLNLIKALPLMWKTVIAYGILCVLELLGIMVFGWSVSGEMIMAWFIEKVLVFGILMAAAYSMKKLQLAGEKISGGDLEYQVDTSRMFLDFKKHGENLNEIGQGLNRAVDQRLKSERMKTELITNVSHDIKTPLTSIINYSDLIGKEDTDNENIKEYAEVLHRQSERLKRLIEDLVEASKASTGNLEVNLAPFEVGVMLAQTAGEYEDKFSASNLHLIVDKPSFPVTILADGRRLWRVMDNILNNVCKYAMPGTRVYLSLEKDEKRNQAVISLKNISKDQLDISPSELLERFVQGDRARNTEGNGLGLSIANSLTELQGGTLKLSIDGDLFKVTLRFPCVDNNLI